MLFITEGDSEKLLNYLNSEISLDFWSFWSSKRTKN